MSTIRTNICARCAMCWRECESENGWGRRDERTFSRYRCRRLKRVRRVASRVAVAPEVPRSRRLGGRALLEMKRARSGLGGLFTRTQLSLRRGLSERSQTPDQSRGGRFKKAQSREWPPEKPAPRSRQVRTQ